MTHGQELTRDITRRRRQPVQERSRRTFEVICETASAIIAEQGLDALTTNAVAEQAGVSITAVYSYFPDKYAIIHELFERSQQRRAAEIAPLLNTLFEGDDWPERVRQALHTMARSRLQDPDSLALRPAVLAVPALRELDRQRTAAVVRAIGEKLRERQPGLTAATANRSAQVLWLTMSSVLDEVVMRGRTDRRLIDEAAVMCTEYLATVFGQ